MLIVCPSCATSYMIEVASLGAGGRMVRCARCRATWFAGAAQEEVSAFVDDIIAEAEAESAPDGILRPRGLQQPSSPPPTVNFGEQDTPFGEQDATPDFSAFHNRPSEPGGPAFAAEPPAHAMPDAAPMSASMNAHRGSHEPETIPDAPSLVPPMEEPSADDAAAEHDADDVESFAARRRRLKSRRKEAKRTSRWTAAILVLFAMNVAVIGGRSEVVRYLPQTATLFAAIGLPVNLQHLKFENVHISPSGAGGEGLKVEGTIVSAADGPIKVPDLRFAARNAAGQEIYTWTMAPARTMLDPGAKLDFSSQLASPPPDAKDVLVRFLTAQEAAAMGANAMKPGQSSPARQSAQ